MKALVRRFLASARGNVAITFSVCCLPAVLVAGAAVDYSRTVTQWSNLQQATDATALTVAHSYLTTGATGASLQTFAQTYLNGLMNGAKLNGAPVISQSNTVVCVKTTYAVPTVFMKIVNINTTNVASTSCSQVGNTYEVAIALDNSSSMSETDASGVSKLSSLQAAAKTLINILIPSGAVAPTAAISIVPFGSSVNVGATAGPNGSTPAFIDTAGTAKNHWQNWHRPSSTFKPTSKLDLFAALTNSSTNAAEQWGGCVEERPYPNVTTDTAAQSSAPDSLFVPSFYPDEPGDVNSYYPNNPYNVHNVSCYPQNSFECDRNSGTKPSYLYINSYLKDNGSGSVGGNCSSDTSYASYDNSSSPQDNQPNLFPGSSLSMVCKYKGASFTPAASVDTFRTGPNHYCTTSKVLPLVTSNSTLTNYVSNNLQASGTTNLVAGFMWAWRTLSNLNPSISSTAYPLFYPTTSTAVIGPQNPKPYNFSPPQNTKVIILMTDGTNTWLANQLGGNLNSAYDNFGYYNNNRLTNYLTPDNPVPGSRSCGSSTVNSNATARCAMDNATVEACNNARQKNVIIYTIGFSVPSDPIDSDGQALLKNCASSPQKFFMATDSTSINNAFQQIASSILSLRLTQ